MVPGNVLEVVLLVAALDKVGAVVDDLEYVIEDDANPENVTFDDVVSTTIVLEAAAADGAVSVESTVGVAEDVPVTEVNDVLVDGASEV